MTSPMEKMLYSSQTTRSSVLRETLPTMYDLPSEDPEEPGLPDDFHYFQPQLLRETFVPPRYPSEQVYVATDLNLYYDVQHSNRYKRPDWFAVLGVPRLYEEHDLRLSYVVWQEGANPSIVVELLSHGTEQEDLGQASHHPKGPPGKWEVYEQFLQIPYYVVFSRYTDKLRIFKHESGRYQELSLENDRCWLPEIELGLGLWRGNYEGLERQWLRWYDNHEQWIPTPVERERQRTERLATQLRKLGIEPEL